MENTKEEALKLVKEHFAILDYEHNFENHVKSKSLNFVEACDHSIITVDRIIKALETTTGHLELRKLDEQEVYSDFKYWRSVKQEIENLKK